jgi:20S proteasome subunit alpha 7
MVPPLPAVLFADVAKGYHGAAVGKGRQLAKAELEKLKLAELSTREAVFEAARM